MTRWYRAYSGTVRDDKLMECASIAECPRSVVIAVWHSILESACDCADGGKFETTPRRIAANLGEPPIVIEAVFSAMQELSLIVDKSVCAWGKRQYESDSSTERVKRHRERQKNVSNDTRNDDETLQKRYVTPPDTDTDTDNTYSGDKSPSYVSAEPKKKSPPEPKIVFDFADGAFQNITEKQVELWAKAYPALDIRQEILRIATWLLANPNKRKSNYGRFINSWLSRQQDKPNLREINAYKGNNNGQPTFRGSAFDAGMELLQQMRNEREGSLHASRNHAFGLLSDWSGE